MKKNEGKKSGIVTQVYRGGLVQGRAKDTEITPADQLLAAMGCTCTKNEDFAL